MVTFSKICLHVTQDLRLYIRLNLKVRLHNLSKEISRQPDGQSIIWIFLVATSHMDIENQEKSRVN